MVPRLTGQAVSQLTITHLIKAGTAVKVGDVLVDFDPQDQVQAALDAQAQVVDLDGQIAKKKSDQAVAQATDRTALAQAEHDVDRAKDAMLSDDLLPKVEAEKNALALEQANAQLKQLQDTFTLKRKAEVADLEILQIQRARAEQTRQYAERNITLMTVRAEFPGVAVLKSTYHNSSFSEVEEGDQVRPGLPIIDVIDPTAMRVRARVNQADITHVAAGQSATIRFDAYPDLQFHGRVELISPLATTSSLTTACGRSSRSSRLTGRVRS